MVKITEQILMIQIKRKKKNPETIHLIEKNLEIMHSQIKKSEAKNYTIPQRFGA